MTYRIEVTLGSDLVEGGQLDEYPRDVREYMFDHFADLLREDLGYLLNSGNGVELASVSCEPCVADLAGSYTVVVATCNEHEDIEAAANLGDLAERVTYENAEKFFGNGPELDAMWAEFREGMRESGTMRVVRQAEVV